MVWCCCRYGCDVVVCTVCVISAVGVGVHVVVVVVACIVIYRISNHVDVAVGVVAAVCCVAVGVYGECVDYNNNVAVTCYNGVDTTDVGVFHCYVYMFLFGYYVVVVVVVDNDVIGGVVCLFCFCNIVVC